MKIKYMRVKVITIPFLTLLILVASITGCAPVDSQETIDIIKDYGDTVQIEVIERKDHPNIHLNDKDYRVDTPSPTETPEIIDGFKVDNTIQSEETVVPIDTIDTIDNDTPDTPDPVESQTPTPIELFESIIATKYTNTAANIRESYTTTSTKIATLPINTEIKVIGIGLDGTEASGWSKIEFNGSEVYVSSSLLSDFKIEIQQPVQTQKPQTALPKEDTPVQKPTQQPTGSQDIPQEILDALAASGSTPSAEGGFDRLPQGPVVVQNTELILPD